MPGLGSGMDKESNTWSKITISSNKQEKSMAQNFNCPNCGATNEYSGVGDSVRWSYCGMDVHPPAEMVNRATIERVSSNAKVLMVVFVVVVVVLPLSVTMGG